MPTRLVAVTAVLAGVLTAAGTGPVPATDLHSYVAAQRAEHGFPGVALAVVDGGHVVDTLGFGSAGEDRPMTADTPMDVGSISKTVTAVAVLQLVERGAVELDTPVRRHLPWFALADPAASEAITVRHLLHHTSGISELRTGGPGTLPADASAEDAVCALRTVALSAPVGARHQYLNVGYTALALVVEAASGRAYPDYVRDNVFAPLGMTRSSADPRDLARPDLAQGHSRLFGVAVPRATPAHLPQMGEGGVTSTASDLARLLAALANRGELDGVRMLSAASVTAMQSPPAEVPGSGYGFGWEAGTAAPAAPSAVERRSRKADADQREEPTMRVRDVMSSPVITVRADTPVHAAAALLVSHGFTAAPVVDAEHRVVGIATEADLVRGRIRPEGWAPDERPEPRVAAVMTPSPTAMRPDHDLADVVETMLAERFRSMPVMEDGMLVGIVTRRDVLRAVARRELTSEDVWRRRFSTSGARTPAALPSDPAEESS